MEDLQWPSATERIPQTISDVTREPVDTTSSLYFHIFPTPQIASSGFKYNGLTLHFILSYFNDSICVRFYFDRRVFCYKKKSSVFQEFTEKFFTMKITLARYLRKICKWWFIEHFIKLHLRRPFITLKEVTLLLQMVKYFRISNVDKLSIL